MFAEPLCDIIFWTVAIGSFWTAVSTLVGRRLSAGRRGEQWQKLAAEAADVDDKLQGRTRHLVNFSVRSSLDPDQRVQIEAEIEEALRQVSLDLWRWHRALEDGLTRIEQMQFRSRTSSRTPSP